MHWSTHPKSTQKVNCFDQQRWKKMTKHAIQIISVCFTWTNVLFSEKIGESVKKKSIWPQKIRHNKQNIFLYVIVNSTEENQIWIDLVVFPSSDIPKCDPNFSSDLFDLMVVPTTWECDMKVMDKYRCLHCKDKRNPLLNGWTTRPPTEKANIQWEGKIKIPWD